MTCKAEVFHTWFTEIYRQGLPSVRSAVISVGPSILTYTLVIDGDLREPNGVPTEAKASIKSTSVTYPPVRETSWCFSEQRDMPRFRKGSPFTTFIYEIYLEEFKQ